MEVRLIILEAKVPELTATPLMRSKGALKVLGTCRLYFLNTLCKCPRI